MYCGFFFLSTICAENICPLVNEPQKISNILSFKREEQNNLLWVFMNSIWFLLIFCTRQQSQEKLQVLLIWHSEILGVNDLSAMQKYKTKTRGYGITQMRTNYSRQIVFSGVVLRRKVSVDVETKRFTQQSESNITVKQVFFISSVGVAPGILHHKDSPELARDISLHTHKLYIFIRLPRKGCLIMSSRNSFTQSQHAQWKQGEGLR